MLLLITKKWVVIQKHVTLLPLVGYCTLSLKTVVHEQWSDVLRFSFGGHLVMNRKKEQLCIANMTVRLTCYCSSYNSQTVQAPQKLEDSVSIETKHAFNVHDRYIDRCVSDRDRSRSYPHTVSWRCTSPSYSVQRRPGPLPILSWISHGRIYTRMDQSIFNTSAVDVERAWCPTNNKSREPKCSQRPHLHRCVTTWLIYTSPFTWLMHANDFWLDRSIPTWWVTPDKLQAFPSRFLSGALVANLAPHV